MWWIQIHTHAPPILGAFTYLYIVQAIRYSIRGFYLEITCFLTTQSAFATQYTQPRKMEWNLRSENFLSNFRWLLCDYEGSWFYFSFSLLLQQLSTMKSMMFWKFHHISNFIFWFLGLSADKGLRTKITDFKSVVNYQLLLKKIVHTIIRVKCQMCNHQCW